MENKDILNFLSHLHHRDPDPLEYSELTCIIRVSSTFQLTEKAIALNSLEFLSLFN